MATPPVTPLHLDPLDYPAEPDALRAGDSWKWSRQFDQYPSGAGWTLQYILNSPAGRFAFPSGSITASEDGSGFDIALTPEQTVAVVAGTYEMYAVLTQGDLKQTFPLQNVRIDPNLATATGPVDTRSFVKKTLDAIEAAIAGDTSANVQEYEIHGRKVRYIDRLQLAQLREHYKREYRAELIAKGEYTPKNKVGIVFRPDY